jgi:hypothetical protein
LLASLGLAVMLPVGLPATGEETNGDSEKASEGDVLYRPPARGKPRRRVGGGVRRLDSSHFSLYSLVPDHTGRTISDQPSLFWYLGQAAPDDAKLVFTLIDDEHVDPLVEAELPRPATTGIQRIDLAGHDVRLEPGTEYEWSVALVPDPEHRANDVIASGWIDRVEPPAELGDGPPSARRYAAAGLWYDALAEAANRLDVAPDDPAALAVRDTLLREAGLSVVLSTQGN